MDDDIDITIHVIAALVIALSVLFLAWATMIRPFDTELKARAHTVTVTSSEGSR